MRINDTTRFNILVSETDRSTRCSGSGKSLALLCASLAWQEAEQKRVDEFNGLLATAATNQARHIIK
jgi:uncharacterized protein YlxP (DUF503 family)